MKNRLALLLGLSSIIAFASVDSNEVLLKKYAAEINQLSENRSLLNSCPGVDLVLTCGNGSCEADKGETAQTCPADCVAAPVRSYNNQTLCQNVQQVFTPSTEAEVQKIVQDAVKNHQHVKVIGKSHSANEILCSDGVVIATEKLNQVLAAETFEGSPTVRTQPGATLSELTEWLHTKKLSIGYSVMGFNGISIAGAISTGSHGSSVNHNTVMANIVKSVRMVQADGLIHEYSEKNTPAKKWKAIKTSFGLMGIITELRLKTEPQTNLEVNVTYGPESDLFGQSGVFDVVKECDWGQINWLPGSHRYMKSCGVATQKPEQLGAHNRLVDPNFPAIITKPVKQVLQLSACSKTIACALDNMRMVQYQFQPPYEMTDQSGKNVAAHHLIGPSHRMMSSQLTPLQKGFFQMDWEIAVPKSRANAAMKAVLDHIQKNNICLPLVGVFLRFAKSQSDTLMAHTVSGGDFIEGEPVVFIEMPVYLPSGFTQDQKENYDRAYEDFAKLLIQNYGGRAHWGKNRDWVFGMQRDLNVYGSNVVDFNSVVRELDPHGLFSNQFSTNMGIKYGE